MLLRLYKSNTFLTSDSLYSLNLSTISRTVSSSCPVFLNMENNVPESSSIASHTFVTTLTKSSRDKSRQSLGSDCSAPINSLMMSRLSWSLIVGVNMFASAFKSLLLPDGIS